LTLAWCHEL